MSQISWKIKSICLSDKVTEDTVWKKIMLNNYIIIRSSYSCPNKSYTYSGSSNIRSFIILFYPKCKNEGKKGEYGEKLLNGYEVSFLSDENVLELDGCTTLWMLLIIPF